MAEDFMVRRDSSANNVPTVGYNEGADAQDVILFGAFLNQETKTTDGTGTATLNNFPVSVSGAMFTDTSGIRRARNFNDDITVSSIDGMIVYYAGSISSTLKTIRVYTNVDRTTVAVGVEVLIKYYARKPIKVNDAGELCVEGGGGAIDEVTVLNNPLNVNITSSDVSLAEKAKTGIMWKLESTIAAGGRNVEIPLTIGDTAKSMYMTNILMYTNAAAPVAFWFSQLNGGSGTAVGWMDMFLPSIPTASQPNMGAISLGDVGVLLPPKTQFKFNTGSSWAENKVHICAYGWQYET